MRKKRTYIILLIILSIFFIVMFLAFGVKNIKDGNRDLTLIVGDNTVWTYSDKKWDFVRNYTDLKDLSWKTYNIYLDNKKFGNYMLWKDDKWYAFDKNKNAVKLDGNLLAYSANYNINISEFSQAEITDYTYVQNVLLDNDLSLSSEFTSLYKIDLDFDNDSNIEEFYVLSNVFANDFDPETIFSIVFMVKDEKIYYIYNDVSSNKSFNGCKPFFTSFLDLDNDNKSEFILSCGRYSISEQVDMLYKYSDEGFKILISNQ